MENSEIPGRIQMERFIPVEIFRKKSNIFQGITFYPFLPKRPKFSVPFVWITSAMQASCREKVKNLPVFCTWYNSIPFLFSVAKKNTSTIWRIFFSEIFVQILSAPGVGRSNSCCWCFQISNLTPFLAVWKATWWLGQERFRPIACFYYNPQTSMANRVGWEQTTKSKRKYTSLYLKLLLRGTLLQRRSVSLAWRLDRGMRERLILHETGFTLPKVFCFVLYRLLYKFFICFGIDLVRVLATTGNTSAVAGYTRV